MMICIIKYINNMADEILYDILKSNRSKLGEFLVEYNNFDTLKDILTKIEDKYNEKIKYGSIIEKLMLGEIGCESNKQRAIYELPTKELLDVIKYICDFIEVNIIEEIGAGLGLLAYMMHIYFGELYDIIATDGKLWMNTASIIYNDEYYNVSDKKFSDYSVNPSNYFDDKLLIICWAPNNEINDLKKLISTKKPKNILLIGDNFSECHKMIREEFHRLNYKQIHIPTKQIGYNQYFKNNIYSGVNTCKSSIIFASLTMDIDINIVNLSVMLRIDMDHCLCNREIKRDYRVAMQDIIHNKIGNNMDFLIQDIINNDIAVKVMKILIYIKDHITPIPLYLNTTDEVLFLYIKYREGKFPLNVVSRDKFVEYKKCIDILKDNNGLNQLKQEKILPNWIENSNSAEKFIWLDYSVQNKKWKLSRESFLEKFNIIYGMNEFSYF